MGVRQLCLRRIGVRGQKSLKTAVGSDVYCPPYTVTLRMPRILVHFLTYSPLLFGCIIPVLICVLNVLYFANFSVVVLIYIIITVDFDPDGITRNTCFGY